MTILLRNKILKVFFIANLKQLIGGGGGEIPHTSLALNGLLVGLI